MQKKMSHVLLVLCFVFIAKPIKADETTERKSPWTFGFRAGIVNQLDTSINDTGVDFSVTRSVVGGSVSYGWSRDVSAGISIASTDNRYRYSGDATLGGLPLWHRIRERRLSLPIRLAPAPRTNLIVIPSIRSASEEGASYRAGQTEGMILGASWTVSKRLSIGPGFGWFSELDGGSSAFPIIVVDWKMTDRVTLATGRGLGAGRGPGLSLAYDFNEKWKLTSEIGIERYQYVLDATDRIGEERSIPLTASLDYAVGSATSFSIYGGVKWGGRFELIDETGATLEQVKYDAIPFIGVRLRARI